MNVDVDYDECRTLCSESGSKMEASEDQFGIRYLSYDTTLIDVR